MLQAGSNTLETRMQAVQLMTAVGTAMKCLLTVPLPDRPRAGLFGAGLFGAGGGGGGGSGDGGMFGAQLPAACLGEHNLLGGAAPPRVGLFGAPAPAIDPTADPAAAPSLFGAVPSLFGATAAPATAAVTDGLFGAAQPPPPVGFGAAQRGYQYTLTTDQVENGVGQNPGQPQLKILSISAMSQFRQQATSHEEIRLEDMKNQGAGGGGIFGAQQQYVAAGFVDRFGAAACGGFGVAAGGGFGAGGYQ